MAFQRPNVEDLKDILTFAQKIKGKIEEYVYQKEVWKIEIGPYYTPLGQDGNPARFLKAKPKTDFSLCTNCKKCSKVCPMQSIEWEDVSIVSGICIKCQACVQICDVHAKYFDDEAFLSHVKMLEENYTEQKENQFWMR